jgi:hypothetical protein
MCTDFRATCLTIIWADDNDDDDTDDDDDNDDNDDSMFPYTTAIYLSHYTNSASQNTTSRNMITKTLKYDISTCTMSIF